MILFFTILSGLLFLNLILLLFSVNKVNKTSKQNSRLDKVYFKPSEKQLHLEENGQYSMS